MIITSQGFGHFTQGFNNQDFGIETSRMLLILDGCSGAKYSEVGTRLFAQLFSRKEDADNLENFEKVKEEIKEINPENLTVFMESTGTYHLPVERYFRENGFNTLVINSLTTKMILLEKRKQTKRIVTD